MLYNMAQQGITPREEVNEMNALTPTTNVSMAELLSSVAVVARVSTSALGMSRTDRQAGKESDRAHGAKQGTSRVSVLRMPGSEDRIKEIKDTGVEGQKLLAGMTTQFEDW